MSDVHRVILATLFAGAAAACAQAETGKTVDTSAGNMGGWYMGGGIETKLPNSPLYLVLEYQHRIYDPTDIGAPAGFDATADVVRLGANLKFNFGK